MKKILMTLIITLPLFACQAEQEQTNTVVDKKVSASPQQVNNLTVVPAKQLAVKDKKSMSEYKGTIHFLNLEGGFYGIVTENGVKLLPMNLAKEYQKPGAVVKVKGETLDVMTIQQWGTPFKITAIEIIELKDVGDPSF